MLDYHNRAHVGIEWTLSLLRQRFCVIKGRSLVKQIKYKCVTCRRLYAAPCDQLMADLPVERTVSGQPPFFISGLDCFGPFKVKVKRSEVKRYGCIFTCLSTRAIHLEKLDSLDTDSFINGLKRFMSRRGVPSKLLSDNGTNFVGAIKELRKAQWFCSNNNVEWQFIPPGAPHMGGIWERLIQTVKRVFFAISHGVTMSDEVLATLLCEVEHIVNSRPITHVSSDPSDHSPLTPNHILMLRAGPPSPAGVFEGADIYRRRWRQVQYMADQFWRRWVSEYLPLLQSRNKWNEVQTNLKQGDVVLVLEENTPRGLWPLGVVARAHPSADGLVRSVTVKTRSNELTRPVTKIVRLECS